MSYKYIKCAAMSEYPEINVIKVVGKKESQSGKIRQFKEIEQILVRGR